MSEFRDGPRAAEHPTGWGASVPMKFEFSLSAEDFVAMNMRSAWQPKRFWYTSAFRAVVVFLLIDMFLQLSRAATETGAMGMALGIALAYGLAAPSWLRWRWRRYLLKYWSQPPRDRLAGQHRLELDEEGISSVGPHHRTFRDWSAITGAAFTSSRVFIETIFGNVYIIPTGAVSDRAGLRAYLVGHLSKGAVKGQ